MKPTSHFAVETHVATFHVPDGLPETRAADHDALTKRWREHYGDAVTPGPLPSDKRG